MRPKALPTVWRTCHREPFIWTYYLCQSLARVAVPRTPPPVSRSLAWRRCPDARRRPSHQPSRWLRRQAYHAQRTKCFASLQHRSLEFILTRFFLFFFFFCVLGGLFVIFIYFPALCVSEEGDWPPASFCEGQIIIPGSQSVGWSVGQSVSRRSVGQVQRQLYF